MQFLEQVWHVFDKKACIIKFFKRMPLEEVHKLSRAFWVKIRVKPCQKRAKPTLLFRLIWISWKTKKLFLYMYLHNIIVPVPNAPTTSTKIITKIIIKMISLVFVLIPFCISICVSAVKSEQVIFFSQKQYFLSPAYSPFTFKFWHPKYHQIYWLTQSSSNNNFIAKKEQNS